MQNGKKIYRAMCLEEHDKTIANGRASFDTKRFKWFSHNLSFILERVRDGKFNNSNFKPDRYIHVLEFDWLDDKCDYISENEIQFDRRRNPTIRFVREII